MAPTVREALGQAIVYNDTSASVTTSVATTSSDLLVVFSGCTYNDGLDEIESPGAGWTQQQQAGNTQAAAMKLFTKPAVGGAETVTCGYSTGGESAMLLLVVADHDGVDVVAGAGVASTDLTTPAPSVTTTADDALLCCGWVNNALGGYAPPSGMTEGVEVADPDAFLVAMAATETIATFGATGTRTATAGATHGFSHFGWAAISVAVAPGGTEPEVHTLSTTAAVGIAAGASQAKTAGLAAAPDLSATPSTGQAKTGPLSAGVGLGVDPAVQQAKAVGLTAVAGLAVAPSTEQVKAAPLSVGTAATVNTAVEQVKVANLATAGGLTTAATTEQTKAAALAAGPALAASTMVTQTKTATLAAAPTLTLTAQADLAKAAALLLTAQATLTAGATAQLTKTAGITAAVDLAVDPQPTVAKTTGLAASPTLLLEVAAQLVDAAAELLDLTLTATLAPGEWAAALQPGQWAATLRAGEWTVALRATEWAAGQPYLDTPGGETVYRTSVEYIKVPITPSTDGNGDPVDLTTATVEIAVLMTGGPTEQDWQAADWIGTPGADGTLTARQLVDAAARGLAVGNATVYSRVTLPSSPEVPVNLAGKLPVK